MTTFTLGDIILAFMGVIGDCLGFLDGISISFVGFTFSLLDFCVSAIVLFLVLRLIFPWFNGDDEE